jgi:hypothetical protein
MHIFRINPSASYSTFPSESQWNSGQKTANTAPDGTYTNAVWIDLDLACGQCHGGSGTAKAGVPYFTKEQLSLYAENIHNTNPTANFSWTTDATTSLKINLTTSGCPAGNTCTYDWDFGDGASATGVTEATASHTYSDTAVRTVTLAINDTTTGGKSDFVSLQVAPVSRNVAPVAAKSITQSGWTVNVIDASSDDAALPAGSLFVDWGNGTSSTGNALATI